ncbi:MAG: metalloregulator ArsR/SmtB family transcription factor [Acidimicrobiia bacterium]|nr:metalloregulator ArsR/SmtB family transcription factor [Acidimicrobiia bacterium]
MAHPANSTNPDQRRPGEVFEALADPNRRALISMLREGDQSVQVLADRLPISRPAVSRHLRVLKSAGLVVDRAEGTRRLYRLDDAGIDAVRRYVESIWGDAIGRFTLFAENTAPPPDGDRATEETDE